MFLIAMNGKPKPLPLNEIKIFLAGIKNQNYHKQFTATIHHFYKLVLFQQLSLKDIPYPRGTEYLPEIFSIQEIDRLVNSYQNLKHRAIIQLMYSCGLRIGEVVEIELKHIRSDTFTIRIAGAKGFKDRDVPVPAATLELLRSYYSLEQKKPIKWLFEGQYKAQYSIRSIQQIFHQGVNRIKITRKVVPHSLRHSRATHLHDAGVDIKDIADFLGHAQIKTTADFYLKLSKKTLTNRVANADTLITNSLKNNLLLTA
jgi:site-specific recombinase XerD